MPTWRVDINNASEWAPNTVYGLGARVVCRVVYGTTARRKFVYECTTAGTSHGTTEPTWPTSGTVNDNDIVWTLREPTDGSWANATCYLRYAAEQCAAGDVILVDDGHAETHNFAATYTSIFVAGTATSPVKVFCVDKSDDSLSVGASMTCTFDNSNHVFHISRHLYSYGVNYRSSARLYIGSQADTNITLESNGGKVLELLSDVNDGFIMSGSPNILGGLTIINGSIAFSKVTHYFSTVDIIHLVWKGGSFISNGSVGCTALFSGSGKRLLSISNVDLTQIGKAGVPTSLVLASSSDQVSAILFSRCKLPSAANFTPTSGSWQGHAQGKVALHHCSSDNKYYAFYEESYQGNCSNENSFVRTGGASDGTTGQSIKMVSSANTVDGLPGFALESPPIVIWNSATTEKTFTIEVLFDSATNLQNDEIWMELEYPANNTDGLGAIASSRTVPLGTPADIPDSSEVWATGAMANPNTRKISVTCTAGKAAPVTARVYLAKPSTTVYVDAKITVS